MKRSFYIVGLFACLLALILLSSFVLLDLNSNTEPLTLKGIDWVADHQVLTALAVSEAAGLMNKKVHGIIQGVLVFAKWAFSFLNHKPAKATKK